MKNFRLPLHGASTSRINHLGLYRGPTPYWLWYFEWKLLICRLNQIAVFISYFHWKKQQLTLFDIPELSIFFQHAGLGPPYGSCGEYPLHMYEEGTTYSYSRCVEQCAAEYAIQKCDCIDAYMPGTRIDMIWRLCGIVYFCISHHIEWSLKLRIYFTSKMCKLDGMIRKL